MDRISELPDALLLRLLSLLPSANDVVATMVLSKRWQFLWMLVPRLVYDDSYQNIQYRKFSRFVDRSLLVHEAPVIETLHFKLGKTCRAEDIRVWIRAASKCSVRELIIDIDSSCNESPAVLPRILYTGCTMLATLKLNYVVLVGVSSPVSFPSLKTLSLLSVEYPHEQFVYSLLSNCHVLEDLEVERCQYDNVAVFTVRVPSLKKLVLSNLEGQDRDDEDGFEINAPSLEYLDITDQSGEFCVIENEMPNIVDAYLDVAYPHPEKILSCITSVKRLFMCLSTSKDLYPLGTVFKRLVHLTLCTCETEWLNLLMSMLRDSPKLRALKLVQHHGLSDHQQPRPLWTEPSSVPECVISSLETLEWVKYEGAEEEKEVVGFVLRNGRCLKKVTISSKSTELDKKFEMMKELTLSIRRSPTCKLAFD